MFHHEGTTAPPDKAVTFFNFPKETLVRYAGKILEPPMSVPIQIADTNDGSMNTLIIEATEKKYTSPSLGSWQRESAQSYAEALAKSRTFVIADSFFSHDSMLQDAEGFLTHGMEPLVRFYENGGTVIVFCVEGIFSIGSLLERFGVSEWRLGKIDNETCEPTPLGQELLGDAATEVYCGKGHMMVVPEHERLFQIKSVSEETYMSDYYGLCSDEEYDEEEIEDAKKSFERYKLENSSNSVLAMHKNENGGRLIWMGDRNQEDPKMRAIFAKLCCG